MQSRFPLLVAVVLSFAVSMTSARAEPTFPMGMNLAGVTDWSSEIVFVDSFKISRPWISQKEKEAFGKGGNLALDERGWIKKLEPGQHAEALMHVDIQPHYPGGKYVCLFEGKGILEFAHAAKGQLVGPNKYAVDVDPTKPLLVVRVKQTDPKNPIRNIRLINAKYETSKSPFYPEFVQRYKGMQVIRFMDWQKTNNSKVVKWSDRTRKDYATQTGPNGVAVEYCLDLVKELNADPWFCIPHLADDDYVRDFAKLLKEKLDPKRKLYVEYSNETWNTMFDQAKHCKDQGLKLGLSTNGYEAQLRYSAQRSCEIFKIFEEVFGGTERLVRVISTHAAHPWTGQTALSWNDSGKKADAIAIAPYFGNAFGDPKTVDKTSQMTVDEILDGCKKMIADNRKKNETYAAEAKKYGLKLMCYESGQHLVGYGGAENNEKLTKLFHEANRHPRMKDLYLEDFKNWQEVGGDTFCVFSSMSRYTKWGSWGVMEWHDQNPDDAPKMAAIRAWMNVKK